MKIIKFLIPDILILNPKPIKADIDKAHDSVDKMIKVKNEKETKTRK